jgi:hypothetical protein
MTPAPRKSAPIAAPAARHPLAFELYLRAIDRAVFFDKLELTSVIEMLERAIDLDPGFADAWGMLATRLLSHGRSCGPRSQMVRAL